MRANEQVPQTGFSRRNLKQVAWEVYVLVLSPDESEMFRADVFVESEFAQFIETGKWKEPLPDLPELPEGKLISAACLKEFLARGNMNPQQLDRADNSETAVFDLGPSAEYVRGHIPGSWFAIRSLLAEAFRVISGARRYVLTSSDGVAARFAWAEANELAPEKVYVLDGGARAWTAEEELTSDSPRYASLPIDRYKRPYEGTDAPPSAMQAYLDWEGGLVAQLARDGTHGFQVL